MAATTTSPVPSRDLWRRALQDPSLRELPFKVETNEHGQLVLSPHKPKHSLQQSRIATRLRELASQSDLPAGEAVVEFAVETPRGIKVPDVVWISAERLARIPPEAEASPAMPELVIEVLSKGNTTAELEEKRRLYLRGGALEAWTCDTDERMTFFGADGEMRASGLVPSFPVRLEPRIP